MAATRLRPPQRVPCGVHRSWLQSFGSRRSCNRLKLTPEALNPYDYQRKYTKLVSFEAGAEQAEFYKRLCKAPTDRLVEQGLAVLDLKVDRIYDHPQTGQTICALQHAHNKPLRDHQLGPGDCVMIRRWNKSARQAQTPLPMSQLLATPKWQGSILDIHSHGMQVILYDTADLAVIDADELLDAEAEGATQQKFPNSFDMRNDVRQSSKSLKSVKDQLRIDKGFNEVGFMRMKAALRAVTESTLGGRDKAGSYGNNTAGDEEDDDDDNEKEDDNKSPFVGSHVLDVLLEDQHPYALASQPSHISLTTDQQLDSMPGASNLVSTTDLQQQQGLSAGRTNPSQKAAIIVAATNRVSLIQGPPGTGKTTTTAKFVKFVKHTMKYRHATLVCAQSNVAVDNLTEAMVELGLKTVRIGAPTKIRGSLETSTLQYQLQAHRLHGELRQLVQELKEMRARAQELKRKTRRQYHKWETEAIQRKREHLEKLRFIKRNIKETKDSIASLRHRIWDEIISGADVVCSTCVGAGGLELADKQFPLVVLDEGSQCSEPEALIPIMRGSHQVVIVGDAKQLPPVIRSKKAAEGGLSLSLFERLLRAQVPSQLLTVQYRMHPMLSAFPNWQFYDGQLQDGVQAAARPPPAFPFRDCKNPVVFIKTEGEEVVRGDGSKSNLQEAELVVDSVRYLILSGTVKADDIGVVTPYAAQVELIEVLLRKQGIQVARGLSGGDSSPKVEVRSVDGYQGREKKVIVFSTVRSNKRGIVGFLCDQRRLNVAITRAKNAMIVLGNPATLRKDAIWRQYLEWLQEHGCMRGAGVVQSKLKLKPPALPLDASG